jgi:hypothetical protein
MWVISQYAKVFVFRRKSFNKKSTNTGETKSKPLSKSGCILKLLTAVYNCSGE